MLAVVPAGSGNDYYRSIKDREELSFPVDVGKVNDLYFLLYGFQHLRCWV